MYAIANRLTVSATVSAGAARRIAVLALVAALVAVALLASGAFHATGNSTASPRWNKTSSVAAKAVFAKPASPRWN